MDQKFIIEKVQIDLQFKVSCQFYNGGRLENRFLCCNNAGGHWAKLEESQSAAVVSRSN